MKDKVKQGVATTRKMAGNGDDILNAVFMSIVVGFSGHQAYTHIHEGYEWMVLGAAAAWCLFQAFRAWSKVLNK